MIESKSQVLDEDVKKGIERLNRLLKDPAKFEKWANETLDMSRLRKR
jgi:AAA+ superfamily predicted ATPase